MPIGRFERTRYSTKEISIAMSAKYDPRAEPVTDPPLPMAPHDLARAYAEIAFGYHQRLPKLEARADRFERRMEHAQERLDAICEAVKAKPRPIIPPASMRHPSIDVDYEVSPTGTHAKVSLEELDRLRAKMDEREARERGAREALDALRAEQKEAREIEQSRRGRWTFIILVLGTLASAGAYALGHFTLEPRGTASPMPHGFVHGEP